MRERLECGRRGIWVFDVGEKQPGRNVRESAQSRSVVETETESEAETGGTRNGEIYTRAGNGASPARPEGQVV